MPYQSSKPVFQTMPEAPLARGIDQLSSEDRIPPGFVEDSTNVDFGSDGTTGIRKGTRTYAQPLPIQARFSSSYGSPLTGTQQVTLRLGTGGWQTNYVNAWRCGIAADSVLLARLTTGVSAPIPFVNGEVVNYWTVAAGAVSVPYVDTELNPRRAIVTQWKPSAAPQSQNASQVFAPADTSGTLTLPTANTSRLQSGSSNTGPLAALFNTGLNGTKVFPAVTMVTEEDEASGRGVTFSVAGASTLTSIRTLSPGAISSWPMLRVFDPSASQYEIFPKESASGNPSGTAFSQGSGALQLEMPGVGIGGFRAVLRWIPQENVTEPVQLSDGGSYTFEIPVDSPRINYQVYSADTSTGGALNLHWPRASYSTSATPGGRVKVTAASVDEVAGLLSVSVTYEQNGGPANVQVRIGFLEEQGSCDTVKGWIVAGSSSIDVGATTQKLALMGVTGDVYADALGVDAGAVAVTDVYRAEAEQRPVAVSESMFATTVAVGTETNAYTGKNAPSLGFVVPATDLLIPGPAFWGSTQTPTRTVGSLKFEGGEGHWATATSFEYIGSLDGRGRVRVTISTPDRTISGTPLASTGLTLSDLSADWLTISSAPWTQLVGQWQIAAVNLTATSDTSTIDVWIDDVTDSRFDTTECAAQVGCFTYFFSANSGVRTGGSETNPMVGDVLTSSRPEEQGVHTVLSVSRNGFGFVCDGWSGELTDDGRAPRYFTVSRTGWFQASYGTGLPATVAMTPAFPSTQYYWPATGQYFTALRFTPKGASLGGSDTEFFSGACSVVGTYGSPYQITFTKTTDSKYLTVGQIVPIMYLGHRSGLYRLLSVSPGTLTWLAEALDGGTGQLGGTIEATVLAASSAFENPDLTLSPGSATSTADLTAQLEFADGVRWDLVLPPVTTDIALQSGALLESDRTDRQRYSRTASVASSLYGTVSGEEPFKFDGVSAYQAGIPRWNPTAFLTVQSSGNITPRGDSSAISAVSGSRITVGSSSLFAVGDKVGDGTRTANVREIDATNNYVYVDKTGAWAGTLTRVDTYRYYARVRYIDTNGIEHSSATFGSESLVVEISAASNIQLRLVGLPVVRLREYDGYEVVICRTKASAPGVFYQIAVLPLSFVSADGYLNFLDTRNDAEILEGDLDSYVVGRTGSGLANGWFPPQECAHLTSIGSALVQANFRTTPQLDLYLRQTTGADVTTALMNGMKLFFRRDAADAGTTSNDTDRLAFEFTTTSGAVSALTPSVGVSFSATTGAAHGLVAGNWVYLFHQTVAAGKNLEFSGWWKCAAGTTGSTIVVLWPGTPASATATVVNRWAKATVGTDVPVFLGTDGNFATVGGNTSFTDYRRLALYRLALAINAAQRQSTQTTGAWLSAEAGDSLATDRLIVRVPAVTQAPDANVTFSGVPTAAQWYANGVAASTSAEFVQQVFGSRLIKSYANSPEVMDSVDTDRDGSSASAVDINANDGQTLTAVLPFFGESAFGAAQQSSVLVVFKQRSAYLVDFVEKAAGRNPVQRVDTQGRGCEAPYSAVTTKDGVIFADAGGVYMLDRQLGVRFIGQRWGRFWRDEVDISRITEFTGHNNTRLGRYYLKVWLKDGTQRDLVYNYAREYLAEDGIGSWTKYDELPMGMSVNSPSGVSLLGMDTGRVEVFRNEGTSSDLQTADGSAIVMDLLPRGTDFGDGAIRKVLGHVDLRFRVPLTNITALTVSTARDWQTAFTASAPVSIRTPQNSVSGVGDDVAWRMDQLAFSVRDRRGIAFQVRIQHSTAREDVQLASIFYRIAGLSDAGTTQAAQSPRR